MSKRPEFIGLDTTYPTASGNIQKRIHMDGAASPLASVTALETIQKLLPHYSNTHSNVHNSAKICTQAMQWAHDQVLSVCHADKQDYTAIFLGSGTTAAINRIVRGLASSRPDKTMALVSSMEHHANDLPHRQHIQQIEYIPLTGEGASQGEIDLAALEQLLITHHGNINYLAVSAVSNVTGVMNPIQQITTLAHQYNVLVLVDAAQMVAHMPVNLSNTRDQVDFFIFSGHKVYTPGAPGVLIAKKQLLDTLPGHDMGGGSVSHVSYHDYTLLTHYPDREQSGTPNFVGAVALASVISELNSYGFKRIQTHSLELTNYLITELAKIDHITVYGDLSLPRIGAVAFNHKQIDHGLFAAILNDYFAIAVRNECFCAHPYVSSLLKQELWELDLSTVDEQQQENYINRKRGMLRVSLSLYNKKEDIDYLIASIRNIINQLDDYARHYTALENRDYQHKQFSVEWRNYFAPL